MSAIQTTAGTGLGAALPVATATAATGALAVPAGTADAAGAFDALFATLTGSLLTTEAFTGVAAAGRGTDRAEGAEVAEAATDAATDAAADPLQFAATVVVPQPLPVVVTPTGGPAGESTSAGAGPVATALTDARATTAPAAGGAAHGGATTNTIVPAAAPSGQAATAAGITAAGITAAGTTATGTTATGTTAATVAAPAPRAAQTSSAPQSSPGVEGVDRDVEAAAAVATARPAADTPATDVAVDGRGLDGRRGMRETLARARSFATGGSTDVTPTPAASPSGASTPEATTTGGGPAIQASTGDTPVAAPAASSPTAPAPGTEPPAISDRAVRLQRALARQLTGDDHAPASAGVTAPAVHAVLAGQPGPNDAGGEGQTSHRRQARVWQSAGATAATVPAAAATAAVAPGDGAPVASLPGNAASSWRAAFSSLAAADTAVTGDGASAALRLPAASAIVTPQFELAMPAAVRGPLVLETVEALQELDEATGEAVHTQIVKSMRMQWQGGVSEAKVTLRPEYLGEVTASIKVEHGVVTASLHADTPEVRRWMESHTTTLRDALAEHGLKLDRLTIAEPESQPAQGGRQSRPRQQKPQQPPRPRPQPEPSETDTAFDVITE